MSMTAATGPTALIPHPCGAVFATQAWQRQWDRTSIETVRQRLGVGPAALPLLLIEDSPFWRGYEIDAGGQRVWTRPVAYLSSVYTFSNPLNRQSAPDALETVAAAVHQARTWDAQALAVTNLEPGPVLDLLVRADQADLAAMRVPAPDSSVRLDVTCRLTLPSDFDGYLQSLSRSVRSELRRRHRRATERSVTFHRLKMAAARSRIEEYIALTTDSAAKHDIPPLYDATTLRAMLDVPGAELITAEREGELLAGILAFRHQDTLVLWTGGIRYDALKEYHPYLFLLFEILRSSIAEGVRYLDFGRGNAEFKSQFGFRPTELHTLVYLPDHPERADLLARLRAMHEGIASFLGLPG